MANLDKHIVEASEFVGKQTASEWESKTRTKIYNEDKNSNSPIEQILLVWIDAFKSVETTTDKFKAFIESTKHQVTIGEYRVDFVFTYKNKMLAVELDGHEFHDRDESQRRYEKQRDRFLQKEGYQVFHYTGKEVTDAPLDIIVELFKAVSNA